MAFSDQSFIGNVSLPEVKEKVNKMNSKHHFGMYLLTLAGSLLCVAVIEQGITVILGELTLAPPLSIIALGLFAAFYSWREVMVAIPLFAALSYFLILDSARFPTIRAISVFLAGILAMWAAYQRVKLVLHAREVEAILKNIGLPWILSDESGNVSQISPRAQELLSLDASLILGLSYFSIFSPMEGKGELIRRYLDLFAPQAVPIHVSLASKTSDRRFRAALSPLEFPGGKRVLTILDPQ